MSRHGLRNISAGAALLCAGLTACGDELPTGAVPPSRVPLLSSSGSLTFTDEVKDACNETLTELRPSTIVATVWGAPGQAAALSSNRMGFPLEGSRYLVVSSGNAERFDDHGYKHTSYTTTCDAENRCDVGGVDLTLTVAAGAAAVQLDYRLYSWDVYASDEFRIHAVNSGGTRELKRARITDADQQPAVEPVLGLRYGKAVQSLTVDLAALGGYVTTSADGTTKTLTLRFEASDVPPSFSPTSEDHNYDSGALIDNIRVLTSTSGDAAAPVVTGTVADPSPVPYNRSSTLKSTVSDAGRGGSPIVHAEYSEDAKPFVGLSAVGSYGTSATQAVQGGLLKFDTPTIRVRTLCVRGEDARGNVSAPECIEQAIYDPAEGYVTGSGWIRSNPGAYLGAANYLKSGRASFGFSSKYKVGANTPSGNTRFAFRDGGLEFQSTSYKWLTVSGSRAQYKGNGMLYINNAPGLDVATQGDYTFMLTAVDGQLTGGGGTDKFRIKIWETRSGTVIYDSQCGYTACDYSGNTSVSDGAVPLAGLGGGGIMIKK